jgi:hypothetical protein
MGERLNVVFHAESSDAPYCLLALGGGPGRIIMPKLLTALADTVIAHSWGGQPTVSELAAALVKVLGSAAHANLLPADSQWVAYLTVHVRRIEDAFRLSCHTMDFAAISPGLAQDLDELEADDEEDPDPLSKIDGFEGTAEELKERVLRIEWD